MHTILCTEIIARIQATRIIGVIIEQVIGSVGNEQAECQDQEGTPGEITITPGKQASDHTGIDSDQCHSGACGDQPLGHDIQRVPLLLVVHLDELPGCLAPHWKVDVHTSPSEWI